MTIRTLAKCLAIVLALSAPLRALAQDASAPPPPPPLPPSGNLNPSLNPALLFGYQRAATFSFGWGQIDNSYYFQIRALLDLPVGPFAFGFQAPLNLLSPVPTPFPADKALDYGGVVRWQDWPLPTSKTDPRYMSDADIASHYLSIIRYIRYGNPTDPLYAQYGEFFDFTLGHGTIMEHYSNALDPNNLKSGLAFAVNGDALGLAVFTDNIAYPDTNILAGRAYVRPFGFGSSPSFLLKPLGIGFTFAEDRNAPRENGGRTATEVGVDVEYQVLNTSILAITPYVDLNYEMMQANGGGLHIGALGRFSFPIARALSLWAKLEYRAMQPTYIPNYFDALYDLQRSAYPVGPAGTLYPQASAGYEQAPRGALGLTDIQHGIYGEATVDVFHMVQAGAALSGTPGMSNSCTLLAFLTLPSFANFRVSAYYLRSDFGSFHEIWELDERSYIAATVLYDVWGPFWAGVTFDRHWVAETNDAGVPTGTYEGVNDFTIGVQTYLPF